MGRHSINVVIKKYNRLTPTQKTDRRFHGAVVWECLCECGNICYKPIALVVSGNTKSCGCLDIETATFRLQSMHLKQKGVNHPSYLGNKIDRQKRSLLEENEWRKAIYKKDNYTCNKCNCRNGKITAHHLNSWNKFPEQRFDINNGITLCRACHKDFHIQYGYGNNTKEQYIEYKGI